MYTILNYIIEICFVVYKKIERLNLRNNARGGYVYNNRLRTATEPNNFTRFYYKLPHRFFACSS